MLKLRGLIADLASLFRVAVNFTSSTEIRIVWHDVIGSRHGYKLYLRPNASEWEGYKVPGSTSGYTFTNLRCGTRYEIYVEAIAESRPRMTSIITASTKGSVPVAPSHQQPLLVDSESVPLDLEAFGDGGCPIGHYVVKYRALDDSEWTVVSKEGAKGHVVALSNLERGRRYKLLLGAANSAGYTERLYDMHVAPAASKAEPRLKPASKCEEVALASWDKQKEPLPAPARNGDLSSHHHQPQQLYAPCPYGTTSGRLRQHAAEATLSRRSHARAEIVEEFYDMPLPPNIFFSLWHGFSERRLLQIFPKQVIACASRGL
ncbi:hypothetical protein HPB48_009502 [Haemaphysalis longicornis]|uniref:Fibronectin type-III domain-containing protein n=1 Tax=Haemaphysalis longicornis TaxID=44386 RepID=A0A9J6GFA1_HAELO|nr:hypothetical protein HPB48_009502 [Haemaphysalis longicornis]